VRREGVRRAFRRVPWLVAATAFHGALLAGMAWIPGTVWESRHPIIEVKFARSAPIPADRLLPPSPPARPVPRQPRHLARARPPAPTIPVVQPRELPAALPEDRPPVPPPPDEGEPEGMVGGITGGAASGSWLPPPPPAFDERTMTRPVFLTGPAPEYTRQALQREVEGLMVIRCVVTVEGAVRDCQVVEGLPFMNDAAVVALQRRRYRPATRNGVPVEVSYVFRLHLKLPP
jgi:protein TonB